MVFNYERRFGGDNPISCGNIWKINAPWQCFLQYLWFPKLAASVLLTDLSSCCSQGHSVFDDKMGPDHFFPKVSVGALIKGLSSTHIADHSLDLLSYFQIPSSHFWLARGTHVLLDVLLLTNGLKPKRLLTLFCQLSHRETKPVSVHFCDFSWFCSRQDLAQIICNFICHLNSWTPRQLLLGLLGGWLPKGGWVAFKRKLHAQVYNWEVML